MINFWIWLAIIFNVMTNVGFKYAAMVEGMPRRSGCYFRAHWYLDS